MPRQVDLVFVVGVKHPEPVKIGELTIQDDGSITGQLQSREPADQQPLGIIRSIHNNVRPLVFAAIFVPTAMEILESFANKEESS